MKMLLDLEEVRRRWMKLLGPCPERPAVSELSPEILVEEQGSGCRKIKVSLAADRRYPEDRIAAWLLIPEGLTAPRPAILALHSTTEGCGKDLVIGEPERTVKMPADFMGMGDAMLRNRAFGLDFVQAGFVVLAPDIYGDGERVEKGHRPYEPLDFYRRYPDWSLVGKAIADNMTAIDYLGTRPEVDARRIGVVGHSLGGHSAVFLAGLDERVKATCTNGGCTVFRKYLEHWARMPLPPEAAASQPPVYCYIPGFQRYMSHSELPNPVEFGEVMGLVAPRPLLYGGAIANLGTPGCVEVVQETWDAAAAYYAQTGAPEALEYNIYPGTHDFPPRARAFTVEWFRKTLHLQE